MRAAWVVLVLVLGGCTKKNGGTGKPADDARADCERVLAHTKQLFEAEGMKVREPTSAEERDRKLQECADKTTPAIRACTLAAKTASDVMDCQAPPE